MSIGVLGINILLNGGNNNNNIGYLMRIIAESFKYGNPLGSITRMEVITPNYVYNITLLTITYSQEEDKCMLSIYGEFYPQEHETVTAIKLYGQNDVYGEYLLVKIDTSYEIYRGSKYSVTITLQYDTNDMGFGIICYAFKYWAGEVVRDKIKPVIGKAYYNSTEVDETTNITHDVTCSDEEYTPPCRFTINVMFDSDKEYDFNAIKIYNDLGYVMSFYEVDRHKYSDDIIEVRDEVIVNVG